MIFSTVIFLIVGSSSFYINAPFLNRRSKLGYILLKYVGIIFLWKLGLLLIRFNFRWIPAYVTATFVSGIGIVTGLAIRYFSSQQQQLPI
jgi:hypothetical protein